jgi:hypothetical protein
MALVGSLIWVYATIVGTDNTQGDRSASVAVVENGLYTVEHGLHLIQLGGLGEFEDATVFDPLGLPAPASDPGEISTDGGSFQIFDYRDAIPAYAFIPLLIFVLVAPALMALYAGFSIARSVSASVLSTGAIWGLSVGPLWAIALALLNELIDKPVFGLPDADSVFAGVFLGGALFGAIGGLLAVRSRPPAAVR